MIISLLLVFLSFGQSEPQNALLRVDNYKHSSSIKYFEFGKNGKAIFIESSNAIETGAYHFQEYEYHETIEGHLILSYEEESNKYVTIIKKKNRVFFLCQIENFKLDSHIRLNTKRKSIPSWFEKTILKVRPSYFD